MSAAARDPIGIWLLDRATHRDQLEAIEASTPRLSAGELDRAAQATHRHSAQLWRAGRIALRGLLACHGGEALGRTSFAATSSGRPHLVGGALHFSVSDSGPWLLIAISRRSIGADVEQPRTMQLAPARLAALHDAAIGIAAPSGELAGEVETLQAWVRIEAFAKAADLTLAACLTALGARHAASPQQSPLITAQARALARSQSLMTYDLALPHGLVGALATGDATDAIPPVQVLDQTSIAQNAITNR